MDRYVTGNRPSRVSPEGRNTSPARRISGCYVSASRVIRSPDARLTAARSPILAFAQHKIFRAPFRPTRTESDAESFTEEAVALNQEKEKDSMETRTGTVTPAKASLLNSRFSSS